MNQQSLPPLPGPQTAAPALPINRQSFEGLTLGDPQLQRDLVRSFLRQLPPLRTRLAKACAHGESQLRDVLHQLKGSCHFIAAERLAGIVAALELDESAWTRQRRDELVASVTRELALLERDLGLLLVECHGRD